MLRIKVGTLSTIMEVYTFDRANFSFCIDLRVNGLEPCFQMNGLCLHEKYKPLYMLYVSDRSTQET